MHQAGTYVPGEPVPDGSLPDRYPVGSAGQVSYQAGTYVPGESLPDGPLPVAEEHPVDPSARLPQDQGLYREGPYAPEESISDPAQDVWAAPARGERRRPLWLIVAGALALVVVAVGGFFVWGRISGDGGAQASADRRAAIEGPVKGYLEAVAQGDAAAALEYLAEEPDSTRLLTDDVLAASNDVAALTDIKVTAGTSTDSTVAVKASYRLGDTDVDQTFTVTESDGAWTIVDGTATVDLSVSTGGLPLAVNGHAVNDPSAVVLFPGSYTLTVAGDPGAYITLGTVTFQVTGSDVKVPTVSATLTDDGVTAFRQAVRASVEACVASPNLDSGCPGSGLDVPASMNDGTVTTEGMVVRTMSPELSAELDALAPRLSGTNPARAFAVAPSGLVNIAITGTRDGQTVAGDVVNGATNQPGFQLGTPEVDMTDPALPVTWSGR